MSSKKHKNRQKNDKMYEDRDFVRKQNIAFKKKKQREREGEYS